MTYNPRQASAGARRKAARVFAARGDECGICHGAMGPIHYGEPRNHLFPLSLAIDEIVPVAQWREGGYESPRACATDPSNWQAAHWVCNARAGDKRSKKRIETVTRPKDEASGTF